MALQDTTITMPSRTRTEHIAPSKREPAGSLLVWQANPAAGYLDRGGGVGVGVGLGVVSVAGAVSVAGVAVGVGVGVAAGGFTGADGLEGALELGDVLGATSVPAAFLTAATNASAACGAVTDPVRIDLKSTMRP